ncbi:MAG: mechanosensitive ion channel family protein [bacterium]|nr:mechanosensitive ion channel family protein [bacterium]
MFNLNSIQIDVSLWLRIIIILLGSYVLNVILRRVFDKVFNQTSTPKTRTVLHLLQNAVSVVIVIIAILTILSALNINILPLLASAGIVGFTIGFGSQAVVKDLVTGLFLLTGDIFYEGDIIKVGEVEGKVEKVGIRAITVRDLNGVVHTIPNGTVGAIANLTKEWSRANIDIGVSTEHPIDEVLKIFNEEALILKNDPNLGTWIIGAPKIDGIVEMTGTKITIKTLIKTNQAKKWELEREFKYRIKKRFEAENLKFA